MSQCTTKPTKWHGKMYVVGTHQKCLCEEFLMSTHNICFHREIRKIYM